MIYLPPPQPILNQDIRLSGDVEVHPTASLAPGVILQAAPGSSIAIGADVCIGVGVIINAYQGKVVIGDGAILGSGVLIIGASQIGNNSCIGTSSTILGENVAAMSVIKPGSIIGDTSRPAPAKHEPVSGTENCNQAQAQNGNLKNSNNVEETATAQTLSSDPPPAETDAEYVVQKPKTPVVGQVYINELLVTLFPHRKNADSNSLE